MSVGRFLSLVAVVGLVAGDAMALVCMICFAAYLLTGRYLRSALPNVVYIFSIYAIAALFFVHYARSRSPAVALGSAAASIFGLLRRTAEAGSREILTVAAQDEVVAPTHRFEVQDI